MYYGKADATAVSNGDNTFLFYDGFDRADNAAIGNGWTEINDIWDISSNTLRGVATSDSSDNNRVYKAYTFAGKKMVEASMKDSLTTKDHVINCMDGGTQNRYALGLQPSAAINYLDNTGWHATGSTYSADTYVILGIMIDNDAHTANYYVNRVVKATGKTPYTGSTLGNQRVIFINYFAGATSNTDWVFIRNFTTNEPTWGTWGGEEDLWTYTDWDNNEGSYYHTDDEFSYNLTGLDPVTEYAYQCQAKNSAGESDWSANAYFTTIFVVEIGNVPITINFGILEVNTTSNTAINYFTITNTGNCAVDVTIQGTDMTGGGYTWVISDTATPGNMIFGMKAGLDDADDLFDVVVNTTANAFVSDLPEATTQAWGLKIWTPTSYDDGNLKTGNVTLTAYAS
jgi:hypothetical protein